MFWNKKTTKLFFAVLIICLFFTNAIFVNAYVSVRGYFRSNGTYVRPYVRSNPNAFKFDNYGWTPSQGLYNPSYYAPTKNYSSDWYTPSYITDPDYYLGKSLYESGHSGLTKPVKPLILPVLTTTTIPVTLCGAHQYRFGTSCYCDDGYKMNYSTKKCEPVICGAHQYRFGTSCYCDDGYKMNYSTKKCE